MDACLFKLLGPADKNRCLACGLGLRVVGDRLDRVGQISSKSEQFASMRRVYVIHGFLFQYLEVDCDAKRIDWPRCGPFRISSQEGGKVIVILKSWAYGGEKDVAKEFNEADFGEDKGPFEIVLDFSIRQSALKSKSAGETYQLAPCFGLADVAGTEGATNRMRKTADQIQEERSAKGAKKQAAVGVKSLSEGGIATKKTKATLVTDVY